MREQRIKLWRHFTGMEKAKTVRKVTEWNLIRMRSKGRPRDRWKDEVLNDVKK
jgi:hypothetical protein